MTISKLVRDYRDEHGISQRQFAELCGLSNGYISMIENNVNPKTGAPPKLSLSALRKVAKGLGMSLTELFAAADDIPVGLSESPSTRFAGSLGTPTSILGAVAGIVGTGNVVRLPQRSGVSAEESKLLQRYRVLDQFGKEAVGAVLDAEYRRMTKLADPKHEGWTTYIKYFDLAVSAGTGEPWMDAAHATRLAIPTEKVPEKANFCVRVNGSSMEPAYKDGDIVFVQHVEDGELREGEIGVFLLNGEGYIKRLGEGTLISLSPEYEPISLHDYDSFRCQGRVLGKL